MTLGHARQLRTRMERAGAEINRLHLWREFDGSIPWSENGVFGDGGALAKENESNRRADRFADFYTSDNELDVPDPWYGGQDGFYRTLAIIEAGAAGIIDRF